MLRIPRPTANWLLLSTLLLPGCNMNNIKQHSAALAGGVLGVVVGDTICGKQNMDVRNVCRVTGAAVGAYLGKQIGDKLEEADRQRHAQATAEVLAAQDSRAASSWTNADDGTSGTVTVTAQNQSKKVAPMPVLKDRVETVPPLELIGEMYTTDAKLNVRVGPGQTYKTANPGLVAGDKFNVVGRVIDQPKWLMIAQGGAAAGYVHADYVEPLGVGAIAAAPAAQQTTDSMQVETVSTCKTVTHEIKYGNGQVETESVNMCQQVDGSWKLV